MSMIKLKTLIAEVHPHGRYAQQAGATPLQSPGDTSIVEDEGNQYFPNGQFDYDMYVGAIASVSPEEQFEIAKLILSSSKSNTLSASEIYHIILGISKPFVRSLYDFAMNYLSPEQLAPTKRQVDIFHK